MAQKNKAQLQAAIDALYLDCGTECITPEAVNTFEKDKTDSYAILNADNDFSGVGTWTKQIREHKGSDIAAGSSLTLNNNGNYFFVTGGTTTITSISTRQHGTRVSFLFDEGQTLQHGANLLLPNNANYFAQSGEIVQFVSEGSGVWRFVGGSFRGLIPAYTTVAKATFDGLIAANQLVPGNWYYVTDCTSSVWGTVSCLVIASGTNTINNTLVFVDYGLSQMAIAKVDGVDLDTLFVYSGSIRLSTSQAASYPGIGLAASIWVIVETFICQVADDGSGINRTNAKNASGGFLGLLSSDFTTFYPYSGQYVPTVTATGFDGATNVKSSYLVQGNILHTMHTIDVDNTSAATTGRIKITVPDGFPIDTATAETVVGTYSLKEAKFYADIDSLTIGQASGEIDVLFAFTTAPTAFEITLSCQSKLA